MKIAKILYFFFLIYAKLICNKIYKLLDILSLTLIKIILKSTK